MFSESPTRFLVEIDAESRKKFESLMRRIPRRMVGEVRDDGHFVVRRQEHIVLDVEGESLRTAWKRSVGAT
jgi:phosphoribosylformylglycinamidine (FGAM) synthase-like enzyme